MGSPVKGETLTLQAGGKVGARRRRAWVLPPQGNRAHLGLTGTAVQWQVLPPQGNRAQAREAEGMAMGDSFVFGDAVL